MIADLDDRTLVVTRIFDAPRTRLFAAWTHPDHLAQWWGAMGHTTVSHQIDVRVGGAYRVATRSLDGGVHLKRGVYREIVTPERLSFTFAWEHADGTVGLETLVTLTFEDLGARTKLTLRQAAFETIAQRDAHIVGWTSCLERFAIGLDETREVKI